jgi:hypothetical protein
LKDFVREQVMVEGFGLFADPLVVSADEAERRGFRAPVADLAEEARACWWWSAACW